MSIWSTKLWIGKDDPLGAPYRDYTPARMPNGVCELATTGLMEKGWVRLTLIEDFDDRSKGEVEVWLSPEQTGALRDALNEALD